jgi:hypothetical protein
MLNENSKMAVFIPTKNEVKKVQKIVSQNRNDGKNDWYDGLSFEQVSILYRHATYGYFTKSMSRFVYPDAQSNMYYMRTELLIKYLQMLQKERGLQAAQDEYSTLYKTSWNTFVEIAGQNIFCRSESLLHVKLFLEQGVFPENAKPIWA